MIGRGIVVAAVAGLALAVGQGAAVAGPSLVVDVGSGAVLSQSDATRPWYPASLSKLMTAYVVFKAIEDGKLAHDAPILISARAARMAPSKMGYPSGTLVTVDDALKMLIVHSANDIAVALAEAVSGSVEAFAVRMNQESQALGMRESHWVNPNGLPDPGQISSARDMAILARRIMTEFPKYAELYRIEAIQSGKRVMRTHNALVYRYPGTLGMKTGFICAGGFNVVAVAQRSGQTLITVVMGSPSAKERTIEAAGLFERNWGRRTGSSLEGLPTSSYASPTDIRDIACNRKKGGAAVAQAEDMDEVTAPSQVAAAASPPRSASAVILPNQMAAVAAVQPQAQPAAPAGEEMLLSDWVIDPPIPVGPYKGPRKPARAGTAVAARPDTGQPDAAGDPAPPAAAFANAPLEPAQPMEADPQPRNIGAIQAGAAPADDQPGLGQIRLKKNRPIQRLDAAAVPAAKPKVTAKPAPTAKAAPTAKPKATADATPAEQARKKPKGKKKPPAPQG